MNRRPRLPGADELFRSTGSGPAAGQPLGLAEAVDTSEVREIGRARRPVDNRRADNEFAASAIGAAPEPVAETWDDEPSAIRPVRIGRRTVDARPTGRERHDEKITVYCSPEELLQIEHARLTLRGSHSLAVDRGRIVREAIAVVLADLEAKGESSILVRRLRGR
jgi:hypothetical protein